MTAGEIVAYLKTYAGIESSQLCLIHENCSSAPLCGVYQKTDVLDMDKLKDTYCKNERIESKSSVDGIKAAGGKLLFIELKGWKEFLSRERKTNYKKIEKQSDKYAAIKKFIDSVDICRDLTKSDFFDSVERLGYILVTDIDVKVNPMEKIKWNLHRLADVSTNIQTVCNIMLQEKLIRNFNSLNIKPLYVYCKDIDGVIENIATNNP